MSVFIEIGEGKEHKVTQLLIRQKHNTKFRTILHITFKIWVQDVDFYHMNFRLIWPQWWLKCSEKVILTKMRNWNWKNSLMVCSYTLSQLKLLELRPLMLFWKLCNLFRFTNLIKHIIFSGLFYQRKLYIIYLLKNTNFWFIVVPNIYSYCYC